MVTKQDVFTCSGHPLVSKVVRNGSLKQSIAHSVSLIGGIDKLVEKDDIILLKPNYNTAHPFPGSSDPEFVKAVIEILYEAGAPSRFTLADISVGTRGTLRDSELTGSRQSSQLKQPKIPTVKPLPSTRRPGPAGQQYIPSSPGRLSVL
ncbi:MAG: DUF362 domain-containing protein [Candidatus Pacebacteria bacterium]|nr:DUF362 domain-containing protein [Candidatus Paceibacterota bacterium]